MGIELPVTGKTAIGELLRDYPQTAEVFSKHNLGCIGCLGASMETVEEGAMMHGLDVEAIVAELNRAVAD